MSLTHAVIRADFSRTPALAWLARLGFFFQQFSVLSWGQKELRLREGSIANFADFFGTSLAGRIGQAVALLLMEERGYGYTAHYPRQQGQLGPDFIVQKRGAGDRALVEAKGMFARARAKPAIKSVLQEGLGQLDAAAGQPHGATKSFCIATVLREVNDPHPEPSMVLVVDPDEAAPRMGDPAWVVRQNYGAWLEVMAQYRLAGELAEAEPVFDEDLPLTAFHLGGVDFVVAPLGPVMPGAALTPPIEGAACLVAGLPKRVFELLEKSRDLVDAGVEDTLSGLPLERGRSGEGISILSDGSLLALLPAKRIFCAASSV